jgi:hypothetical protein
MQAVILQLVHSEQILWVKVSHCRIYSIKSTRTTLKTLKHLGKTKLLEAVTTEFILIKPHDVKKAMEKELRDNTNRLTMDRQKLWLKINEAFKVVNFEKPSDELRST